MAQLKDSIVSGNLRVTDTTLTDTLQVTTIKAPATSGGTTYGPGTSGQVLKSNGTSVYWGADNNSITGSGTSGYLTKWNGTNSITNGPQLGSSTTTFLRNDGTWATPVGTTYGISGAFDSDTNSWVTTITAGGSGTTSSVPPASISAYGITKLYNGVDSSSTGLAATANAVKTAYDKANHSHPYLPLAGGTMTGVLTLKGEQYSGNYAMDCNNSDIIHINSLRFNDTSDSYTEGISFARTNGHWDTIWANGGEFYFTPNHETDVAGATSYKVLHTNNTSFSRSLTSGTKIGTITIAGTATDIYAPSSVSSITDGNVTHGDTDHSAGIIKPVWRPLPNGSRSNKFAFIPAANITAEYSTNGGSSWTAMGTDAGKADVFIMRHSGRITVGPDSTTDRTTSMQTRITITNDGRDFMVDQFYIWATFSGHTTYCDIYYTTQSAKTTWVLWRENVSVSGWAGGNIINVGERRFGDTLYQIRFVFRITSVNANYKSQAGIIYDIQAFGQNCYWISKNNMMALDHLYSWDRDQKAYFPNEISIPTQMRIVGNVYGMIIRNDNNYTYLLPTNAGDPQGSWRAEGNGYYFPFYIQNSTGKVTMKNLVEISGTLMLSKTTDAAVTSNNSPALIVGGTTTTPHIEIDNNEIIAKADGTTGADLYINSGSGGGYVFINDKLAAKFSAAPTSGQLVVTDGTTGSVKSSGYTVSSFVPNTKTGIGGAINLLDSGTDPPKDDDYYISQWAGGSTTNPVNETPVRRKHSALWSYINGKISATTGGSGNAVTSVSYANGVITATRGSSFLASTTKYAGSSSVGGPALSLYTDIIDDTAGSHATVLQTYFNANKSTIPRDKVLGYYSRRSSNGSIYMGYFLHEYDSNPYGGFFVAHYNTPYYVGISNGTYTEQEILTSTNYTAYTVKQDGTYASGSWGISVTGTSANVTGTVAIDHGGTGATTRLNALKNLTNENVGTSAQFFLTITNSWGKGGYTTVADAKTVLGLGSAAYTSSTDYVKTAYNQGTSGTKYGILFTDVISASTDTGGYAYRNAEIHAEFRPPSTSTRGWAEILLGNAETTNATGSTGWLGLYNSTGKKAELSVANGSEDTTHYLPNVSGTILNSGTTSYTQTVASSVAGVYEIGKIKINGTPTTIYGHDVNTTYTLGTSESNVTLTPSSGSVQSITVPYATRSSYIDIVASNEVRFSVATKPANATDIHIGHAWSDGTSDAKINTYIFKNGAAGLALIKSKGYYLVDSGGNTYTGLYDNGSNLWIGSTQTQAKHHIGQTYISAGYNSANSAGNSTIYISVPTSANNNGTNYAALHAGNFTTTGSGNAITSVAFTNEKLTFTKGSTFSLSTHTHNYAGSASAGGPAISVATTEANANADRVVFFADNTDTKKLVYDNDFKYNPSTGMLNAGRLTLTSSTWGGLIINRTAANAHAGIVFQQNGTDLGSISMGEADSPLIRWKGNTAYKVYDEGNVQPMLWRYTPEDDPSTATNAGLYPSYTMAYMQNSSDFGGTANRRGNSGTSYWAHYLTFTYTTNSRYLLRLPFWGVPQYQHTTNGINQRWYSFVTEEEFSAYKALQERYYSVSSVGWYRLLTFNCEGGGTTGNLIRDVTITVRRQYNNASPEAFAVRIIFNYDYETIQLLYAKQNVKCFTKIRTSRSSDKTKVYVELYYDFSSKNDFSVRYDNIKCWDVSESAYMPQDSMPANGTLSPISDSPTAKTVLDIPTNVLQSNLKLIGSYWGMCGPDGNDASYIRTSSDGLLPYEAGGITNPHTYIGTSANYFSAGYIKYISAGEVNTHKDDLTREITYGYDTIDFKYNSTGGWATGIQWKANNAVLTSIGGYGTGTTLNYMWIGGSNYESPALKIHSNLNIEVTANHNILLRTHANGTYKAGIAYDTQGNECVAFWAKNAVTRFRFHSGVDMETFTTGSMMGIDPDFEIYHTAVTSTVPLVLWNPTGGNTPELIFRRKVNGDDYVDWRVVNSSANLYFDYQYNSTSWTSRLWLEYNGGMGITGPLKLKTGTYTTTISQGTTTTNRTLVLPDKSGGIPVANILYEDDTGAHSYKVADAKNYKYFIITVHHGSFENQTGTIVPTTLSTTTHCYFTISFVDPTSAGNIRVGTADIIIAPDSSTNSITFTASASSHHLAIAGNSSSLTNITTSSPTSMVIRKIVGFM